MACGEGASDMSKGFGERGVAKKQESEPKDYDPSQNRVTRRQTRRTGLLLRVRVF